MLQLLGPALHALDERFSGLPNFAPDENANNLEAMSRVLAETADRLADNYPYFHPLYAGQMLKSPHPLAHAAYALAQSINPNNHARDGGRASSVMELEAVAQIAAIFGWQEHLGHLTSGGTFANLEALWIAGQLAPGKRILASSQAHYTHNRISSVLKLPFAAVECDAHGRMRVDRLEAELKKGDVGLVVATLGSTGIAAVDPIDQILALRSRYGFRLHIDGAYGGYFRLIADELEPEVARAVRAADQADSLAIDPHKHGLQPYGCGCILFRDPAVGRFYKHDSPYTYFTSKELHLGEISLECSRAGAAAVALWATQRLLPPIPGGEFAAGLSRCRQAAVALTRWLDSRQDLGIQPLAGGPDLDIAIWRMTAASMEQSSLRAEQIFSACASRELHLALVQLPQQWFDATAPVHETVTCLRSVLMKPEHLAWLGEIEERFAAATQEIGL